METHWFFGILVAFLVGLNTLFWGLVINEVGHPEMSLKFLFTLLFDKWFIMAMITGFSASILSYWVYSSMGVMLGRFFLSISIISIIIVGVLFLGETITIEKALGIALIIVGALLLGRL